VAGIKVKHKVKHFKHKLSEKEGFVHSRFSKTNLAIFGVIFAAIGGFFIYSSFAASTATVTVTNTTTGTMQTQLSTNIVPYFPLNSTAGAQTKFNALHPPFVRLHIGHDSTAMPEIKQNLWKNTGETRAFESLDELVNEVYASNQQVLMNIKFAPPWQWTCTVDQATGTVRDQTFQEYAQYMARLVDYYNKGSMVTEQGVTINNPLGTAHKITYWELWNEPDLNNETPCVPADDPATTGINEHDYGLTYQRYTTMWNAVTAAMLAKDSTLKFVGPATAGGQFGSGGSGNQYIDYLMANSVTKPTALSFHGYGYWDNTVSDHWIFDGDGSCSDCGGVSAIANAVNSVHTKYPTYPIWLTEVNVNADWGNDIDQGPPVVKRIRPISEFSAAWWGAMFAQTAPMNAGIIHQYDVLDDIQFGLININNGNTFTPYHVVSLLNDKFPQGSTILSSSSNTTNVLSLTVRRPDGHISVMVVNRQLANNTVLSSCGAGGVPVTVTLNLSGITATSATLQQIDKNNVNCTTNTATAPTVQAVNVAQPLTVTLPGYGLAVFDITPTGASTDTTPPVISNVSAGSITSSSSSVAWTTDEISDSQVEYGTSTSYGSSTTLNTSLVTTHSIPLSGLTPGTLYHYRVISKDASANTATSNDATFTTSSDATSPTVSMTAPAANAFVRGTVAFTANASDNVGVVGVQFQVDGANQGVEDTAAPYTRNWNTTTASNATNGTHIITAIARDAAGNTTTSSSITVTVDNAAPTTSITAPTTGATVSGSTTAVTASATDNMGIAGVQFQLDGANLSAEDTTSPYSITWNTTTATNGSHTLTATARDAAGNTTTSAGVTLTVNNAAAAKTGDLNGDNAVDITDLSLMLSSYGQTTTQCVTNSAYKCDLSTPGDNTVNIFDLSILLSHYGS
jgi:hypothetical protein